MARTSDHSVLSRLTTPPGSPATLAAYFVIATATGAWAGKEGKIAVWGGSVWLYRTPAAGDQIYSVADAHVYVWSGSALAQVDGGGGGGGGDALVANPLSQFAATTSSQLAGVISDETGSGALVFATSPTLVTPALGTPTSGTLTNCTGLPATGIADRDTDASLAANSDTKIPSQKAVKTYVDTVAAGLKWKQSVLVATTAAGTLSTSFENGDVVDDITLTTGDRILLKNQAAGAENGIYIVAASGAPARATDADTGSELVSAAVFVQRGTANGDKAFVCTTDAITIGSTSQTWTAFASVVGALIAANNLSDVASAATSRTNLGLGTLAVVASPCPEANGGTAQAVMPIPVSLEFFSTGATAVGSQVRGLLTTTDFNPALKVPTGKTLYITSAMGRMRAGATAGTYTLNVILRNATDSSSTTVATATGANGTDIYPEAVGSLGSPLATLAAGKKFLVGWENGGSSPGALDGTEKHHVLLTGYFI